MLARYAYHQDPQAPHTQYALTEIGDETRHIIMFAKAIERLGAPTYRPRRLVHQLARVYKATARGPALFAPVLVAEEITDRLQRETMNDESIHPLVRMVNRIHVVEEARHVRFAREEVARLMPRSGPIAKLISNTRRRPRSSAFVVELADQPGGLRAVGLDPQRGRPRSRGATRTTTRRGAGWARRSWPSWTSRAWSPGPPRPIYRLVHLI